MAPGEDLPQRIFMAIWVHIEKTVFSGSKDQSMYGFIDHHLHLELAWKSSGNQSDSAAPSQYMKLPCHFQGDGEDITIVKPA